MLQSRGGLGVVCRSGRGAAVPWPSPPLTPAAHHLTATVELEMGLPSAVTTRLLYACSSGGQFIINKESILA